MPLRSRRPRTSVGFRAVLRGCEHPRGPTLDPRRIEAELPDPRHGAGPGLDAGPPGWPLIAPRTWPRSIWETGPCSIL